MCYKSPVCSLYPALAIVVWNNIIILCSQIHWSANHLQTRHRCDYLSRYYHLLQNKLILLNTVVAVYYRLFTTRNRVYGSRLIEHKWFHANRSLKSKYYTFNINLFNTHQPIRARRDFSWKLMFWNIRHNWINPWNTKESDCDPTFLCFFFKFTPTCWWQNHCSVGRSFLLKVMGKSQNPTKDFYETNENLIYFRNFS